LVKKHQNNHKYTIMTTLLIASGNIGKLREIEAILTDFPVDLVLPKQLGLDLDITEDGATYAENAAKKAAAYTQASGLIVLADDSGLEVDALGGQPGLFSARYAPWPDATDADRRRYLLQKLQDQPLPCPAHFHCTVAIAVPGGEVFYAEGDCHGEIIAEERGSNGFGYDPIFYLPEYGLTMAELAPETKNQISHRARAVRAALPILRKLFS
jgi:XTP/dITP diphosphohydrolase